MAHHLRAEQGNSQSQSMKEHLLERKRVADEETEERNKVNISNQKLQESYVDYLIIKNIYDGSSYYVTNSQMKQAKAVTLAIQNYYKNSIQSTDSVWDSAVRNYEINWASEINSLNSFSAFNTQFSGFVDLRMMAINNRARKLGISPSNTVKDF